MSMVRVKKNVKASTALVEAKTRQIMKKRFWACMFVFSFLGGTVILVKSIAGIFAPACTIQAEEEYVETIPVSWNTDFLNGKPTASGADHDSNSFTAAHPSLPFQTEVFVTNPANGNRVKVTIDDRGPGLVLSKRAFAALNFDNTTSNLKGEIIVAPQD